MACLFFLLKAGKERFESYIAQELHGIVNFTKYSQNTKAHKGFGSRDLGTSFMLLEKTVVCEGVCWGGYSISPHRSLSLEQYPSKEVSELS